jgi:hypothetical protein
MVLDREWGCARRLEGWLAMASFASIEGMSHDLQMVCLLALQGG